LAADEKISDWTNSVKNSDLGIMARKKEPRQLAKLMDYILSRRPDEFGLVADADGYVKIKDLIKAITEEEGWRYVRRSHIDEVIITLTDPGFEICGTCIRATQRQHLPQHCNVADPPSLLYACIRPKAYPGVALTGIRPSSHSQVILSSRRDLCERIGRRIDPGPVILTIQVQNSVKKGVVYRQAGEHLFLADFIPPDCFTGPRLPKEKTPPPAADKPEKPEAWKPPGSFFIDLDEKSDSTPSGARHRKGIKKQKRRRERPPWRR